MDVAELTQCVGIQCRAESRQVVHVIPADQRVRHGQPARELGHLVQHEQMEVPEHKQRGDRRRDHDQIRVGLGLLRRPFGALVGGQLSGGRGIGVIAVLGCALCRSFSHNYSMAEAQHRPAGTLARPIGLAA